MQLRLTSACASNRSHVYAWLRGELECPWCYANRSGRSAFSGHAGYSGLAANPKPREVRWAMKRPDGSRPGGAVPRASALGLEESYPTLAEYLCDTAWEDGKPREVATLLVVTELGAWKACVNDRACARSLWVSAESFAGVLEATEAALCSLSPGWRQVKPYSPRK